MEQLEVRRFIARLKQPLKIFTTNFMATCLTLHHTCIRGSVFRCLSFGPPQIGIDSGSNKNLRKEVKQKRRDEKNMNTMQQTFV